MKNLHFKYDLPKGDRRNYVNEGDVKVLKSRLPAELGKRLRGVYFKDQARGRRIAGYVLKGHKEIVLCALPPRVSLTSYLRRSQNPSMFGAIRGCQWPTLAVRRFMLYDVFLHELGHLQIIDSEAKSLRRKFAGETKAQDFAEYWRKKLWSENFSHPDPVHNPPSKEELDQVYKFWKVAHDEYKKGLQYEAKGKRELAATHYSNAIQLYEGHSLALEALGIFTYDTVNSSVRAISFLKKAIHYDPTLHDANLFLGLAYAEENKETEAEYYLERAIRVSPRPHATKSVYARVLLDWGYYEKAKALFERSIKNAPNDPFILHHYKRFLLHDNNPEKDNNLKKHASLFEDKDLNIDRDKISIYSRGLQVVYWYKKDK